MPSPTVPQPAPTQDEQVEMDLHCDLTNIDGMKKYIARRLGLPNVELEVLAGGTANYVYRLLEPNEENEGRLWILKHAAGHLSSNPGFNLPPSRMDLEARILTHKLEDKTERHCTDLEPSVATSPAIHVHTVPLIFYEKDLKLLCIRDAGSRNLFSAYRDLSKDDVQKIGTAIGKWLARLHTETPHSNATGDAGLNNQVGVMIVRHTYNNLSSALAQTGYDAELGLKINSSFGELLAMDDESVCHGDFWPGNVMLQNSSITGAPQILTVIDWELVRVGSSATDVGQFAAEAFMLDRFCGNKGLRSAFLQSYYHARTYDSPSAVFQQKNRRHKWMTRAAVHFAAHLAFWPSRQAHWANKEDTKPLFDLAFGIIRDAASSKPDAGVCELFEGVPILDETTHDMPFRGALP
jgi:thiamine kinase-like enzyme